MALRLTTNLDYNGGFKDSAARIRGLEQHGLDVVWVSEAYGFDSPSLMGFLAAVTETVEIGSSILPVFTRTPTVIAMTAAGIDSLSDGRFHLGLGASGPQVIEGWHGVPFESSVALTEDVIHICRNVWRREAPLQHAGRRHSVPLAAGRGKGVGRPLRSINKPVRPSIPIWLAALGAHSVRLTARLAEGWIPALFAPEWSQRVWGDVLNEGKADRPDDLGPLQVSAGGLVCIGDGDEVIAARDTLRPWMALYIGGMGAPGANFYNQVMVEAGFESEAAAIQEAYLDGRKREPESLIPASFLEAISLCGPLSYVTERMAAFAEAGVTHLNVTTLDGVGMPPVEAFETLAASRP